LEPEILIIDEVLAVGDAQFQKKCLNKMEDIGQKGRTVLFVSHNMTAVTRLCDRTILLDDGLVVEDGPSHQVVRSYMTSDSGTTAAREWADPRNAPGGDIARLRAVRVKMQDGRISETFDIRQPVGIEMEYEVLKSGHLLFPHHHFFNTEGVWVFCANYTQPEWRGRPHPAGRYKSTAWIPGNLLNEGMLLVNSGIITLDPNIKQFYERAVVAFQVVENNTGPDSARGDWTGPIRGAVRPAFQWQTRHISDEVENSQG
jgi:lipopolysaccharide transport system ATP-binding protein